jgi:UDPglucose 6-dehydrogenase
MADHAFLKMFMHYKTAAEYNYDFKVLTSVMDVNEKQKTIIVDKVRNYYDGNISGKKFAVWGLAFKPDTDDIREAPALYIIRDLLAAGATVTAFDPEAMENVKKVMGDSIQYAADPYESLQDADALLIATEWSLFRTPDFEKMKQLMKARVIFDGRNLYDLQRMTELGFYYNSIGREIVQSVVPAYS